MKTCHKCKIDVDDYEIFTYMGNVIYLCSDCGTDVMDLIDSDDPKDQPEDFRDAEEN